MGGRGTLPASHVPPLPPPDVSSRRAEERDAPAIERLPRAVRIHARGLDWRHFAVATAPGGELVGASRCGLSRAAGTR